MLSCRALSLVFSRFFASGDLGRPLFCTAMVSSGFSSSPSAVAAPSAGGEIGTSIVRTRATGAVSLSEMLERRSDLILSVRRRDGLLVPAGRIVSPFCCSCSRFPSCWIAAAAWCVFGSDLSVRRPLASSSSSSSADWVPRSSFLTACSDSDGSSVRLFPILLHRLARVLRQSHMNELD